MLDTWAAELLGSALQSISRRQRGRVLREEALQTSVSQSRAARGRGTEPPELPCPWGERGRSPVPEPEP